MRQFTVFRECSALGFFCCFRANPPKSPIFRLEKVLNGVARRGCRECHRLRCIRRNYSNSSSSATRRSKCARAVSTGSGCSMSTPASRSRSSGYFEQPALQEAEIVAASSRWPPLRHALGQGDRRRQAGGVLVDVKRAIEMRNAEALQRQLVVDHEIGAEVRFQQLAVHALEAVDRQRLACFGQLVRDAFRTRRTSSGG